MSDTTGRFPAISSTDVPTIPSTVETAAEESDMSISDHVMRMLAGTAFAGAFVHLLSDPVVRTLVTPVLGAVGALAVSMIESYKRKWDAKNRRRKPVKHKPSRGEKAS